MTDQMVTSRHVLHAITKLRRLGHRRALEQLEQVEPDLAEYVMETLTSVHGRLVALGGAGKPTHRAYREIVSLALISIASMQRAHYDLWRHTDVGRQLHSEHDEDTSERE